MKSVWSGEPQAGELAVPKQHGAAGQAVTTGQGNFSSMEAWAVTGILHGPEIKCKTVECLGSLVSDSLIAVHHINCDQLQSRNLVRCKLAVGGVSVASLDKFAEYFPELWRASHKCQTMGSAAPACPTFDVQRSTFDVRRSTQGSDRSEARSRLRNHLEHAESPLPRRLDLLGGIQGDSPV